MIEPRIFRELLDLFRRSEIPIDVRSAIANELGKNQYLPAKDFLLQELTNPDSNMRSACIRAVGIDMELREAAPILVEILLNDEYEHVKIDAAYGLGALRYKQALPALKQVILEGGQDPIVRDAAYKAVLSILGREEEELPEIGEPTAIDWELVNKL